MASDIFERITYLIGGEDDEQAVFIGAEAIDGYRLTCRYRGKEIQVEAPDFFAALQAVRLQLEGERLIPFCYGASLNVYPSGMARDMGRGLKAYTTTLGQAARRADLVDIFAESPDVVPSLVAAQDSFWKDWLASDKA